MSAAAAGAQATGPFRARIVVPAIGACLLAAAGYFVLSSYAPDFRRGANMYATAHSNSAAGYSGLIRLLELTGQRVVHQRTGGEIGRPALLVVFIDPAENPETVAGIVQESDAINTLMVLPKWRVRPVAPGSNRITRFGPVIPELNSRFVAFLGEDAAVELSDEDVDLIVAGQRLAFEAPLQSVDGDGLSAINGMNTHTSLLKKARDSNLYVLSEPDLLNNANIDRPGNAAAALDLLDTLAQESGFVAYRSSPLDNQPTRNLGKLLIEPPFLPLTLILLAAAAMALIAGFNRFGPVAEKGRAIAFGKRSLIEMTAELLRRGGRLDALGPAYASLARRRAAARLGAPAGLPAERLDAWLDRLDPGEEHGFTRRLEAARTAKDEAALKRAAEKLDEWIGGRANDDR